MKHAFIFGTNIFLSSHNTVSYIEGDTSIEFLKILSFYHHKNNPDKLLVIDAEISSLDDHPVTIINNTISKGSGFSIVVDNNRVKLFQGDNHEPVLDVFQLDEHEYAGLSSHITNEILSQQPDAVLTIKGNFRVNGGHIHIENEKMFINGDGFANAVDNAHNGVTLTSNEVHF